MPSRKPPPAPPSTCPPRPVCVVAPTPHSLIPPMNALEILRETARILRHFSAPFLAAVLLLICPVSAALLSNAFLTGRLAAVVAGRFMRLAVASGLPLTLSVRQVCSYLAATLLSSASCFPLILTLLLAARSAVAYSVACVYASKQVILSDIPVLLRNVWRRLASTYLCACCLVALCLVVFITALVFACSAFAAVGYPPHVLMYLAFVIVLCFSVVYVHMIVLCNVAGVISVLEERSGMKALLRSLHLIKGQTNVGLLIFLVSILGMAFVEGLFEHRVKTLSYGDGSSRIWEGPLLVVMYSFVLLVDSIMSAVFYFTCRSSSLEELNANHDLKTISSSAVETGDHALQKF